MPLTPAQAFEKRYVKRNDGSKVVPTSLALVAALESGYKFKLSDIEEASSSTQYPGMMVKDEFVDFCEKHPDLQISANEMAKHVSVLAPDGNVTRASLQDASAKAGSDSDALNPDEVDALFTALDGNNTGSISAEQLMEAMYGEEGLIALEEQRLEYTRMKREQDKKDRELAAERERAAAAQAEREKIAKEEAEQRAGQAAEAAKNRAVKNEKPPAAEKKKAFCGC